MDYRRFSKNELIKILEIIQSAVACRSEGELRRILVKIQNLVGGDYNICGIGEGDTDGSLSKRASPKIINNNYPLEWLRRYNDMRFYHIDPIVWYNFQYSDAQLWEDTYRLYAGRLPRGFVSESRDFGLIHGVSGGIYDQRIRTATIFTFSGTNRFDEHHKNILSILTPHLHQALLRISNLSELSSTQTLTKREREILQWIKEGKTNWEISVILDISERTVKFHVQNIERKLNAVNKAHAIAIACDQRLVTL